MCASSKEKNMQHVLCTHLLLTFFCSFNQPLINSVRFKQCIQTELLQCLVSDHMKMQRVSRRLNFWNAYIPYIPIAMYVDKMFNVLQTCPYVFWHAPFKQACLAYLNFVKHTSKIQSKCLCKNNIAWSGLSP